MINYTSVTRTDQIRHGDKLILIPRGHEVDVILAVARRVIEASNGQTEVVYNLKKNKYFNVSMMLKGESWIEAAIIIRKVTK
jgi:hypothetical protein